MTPRPGTVLAGVVTWLPLSILLSTCDAADPSSRSAPSAAITPDSCTARIASIKQAELSYDQIVSCLNVLPKDAWPPFIELGLQYAGTPMEKARIEHDAALLADRQGLYHEALKLAQQADEVFESRQELVWHAASLFNQGTYFSALGRGYQALDRFHLAAELYRELPGRQNDEAKALAQSGWVFFLLGDSDRAASYLEKAVQRHSQPLDRAATLDRLGSVYRHMDRIVEAEDKYREALELLQENPLRGHVIANLGWVQLDQQHPGEAEALLRRALPILQRLGDVDAVTHTLVGLASAAREQGKLDEAGSLLTEALDIVESLRAQAGTRKLQVSFWALRQNYFLEQVDLFAEQHLRQPDKDWDERTLIAEEKRRARSLLDALQNLSEKRTPSTFDATLELHHRITSIEREIRRATDSREAEALRTTLRRAISEYEMLQTAVTEPGGPVTQLPIPSVAELQSILDDETSVLVYSLGAKRSWLFYLDADSLEIFKLPPRGEIETLSTIFLNAVKTSRSPVSRPMVAASGTQLSQILIAPVKNRLRKRVRIVRDGLLHLLPFAALPGSDETSRLLIHRHEITSIPSLTALAWLEEGSPQNQASTVAVMAPDTPDGRIAADPRFPLLTGVQAEIEAIQTWTEARHIRLALGRAATREALIELTRTRLRVLHIATHGVVYRDLPELSTLVLTDSDGHDDYLRLTDIFNLRLNAQLVVLSACETAVGEILKGEGMVGMSNAFLSAGASTVLASLWSVDDQYTRELMGGFYSELLLQERKPADALRQAQLSMLAEGDESSIPYHWAAFELFGL